MSTTPKTPQELMSECQGLVRTLALKLHRSLPPNVDLDDLIGYGQIGLAEAANAYNPSRGVKFSTFAYYRIRGAVFDGLGKMAWTRQSRRRDVKYRQMANELLENENANNNSGGSNLQDDVSWFKRLSSALAVVYLSSGRSDSEEKESIQLVDQSVEAPPAELCGREIRQILQELIDALPTDESALIRAAYYEGLTLQEAARRIGVSKSWASRLHARTLQRLANSLKLMGMAE